MRESNRFVLFVFADFGTAGDLVQSAVQAGAAATQAATQAGDTRAARSVRHTGSLTCTDRHHICSVHGP